MKVAANHTTIARLIVTGGLIAMSIQFIARMSDGPPNPFSNEKILDVCKGIEGCKSVTVVKSYDPDERRNVLVFQTTVSKKTQKAQFVGNQLTTELDALQKDAPLMSSWGWSGRKVEVRYE